MLFDIKTPFGGKATIEVKPAGTRRTTRDEKVKVYDWSCNAFLGQHGEPFGTIDADSIGHAESIVRDILGRMLRRKASYEEVYARNV